MTQMTLLKLTAIVVLHCKAQADTTKRCVITEHVLA